MTSQSNSVLSGIAAASDPVKTNESIKDIRNKRQQTSFFSYLN